MRQPFDVFRAIVRALLGAAALLAIVSAGGLASAQDPPIDLSGLGDGRYATMTGTVEKTVLRIDAYQVTIRFDEPTEKQLQRLADGRTYSEALEEKIAQAARDADQAYVRQVFLVNTSKKRLVDGILESVKKAYDAGWIDEAAYRKNKRGIPRWFSFLDNRGVRKGDQILYRIRRDELRTVYLDKQGKVLFERTDRGAEPGRTTLAAYFAPRVDAREPLIKSLFD